MIVGVVAGLVIVLGVIIGVASSPKSTAGPRPQPIDAANPPPAGGGEVQLSTEDRAALAESYRKENEAKAIYGKYISGSGALTISGPPEAAIADMEQGLKLSEEASHILENLSNKYGTPMGEGKSLARMIKGFRSGLRELRAK
jgi:hypothetical protein